MSAFYKGFHPFMILSLYQSPNPETKTTCGGKRPRLPESCHPAILLVDLPQARPAVCADNQADLVKFYLPANNRNCLLAATCLAFTDQPTTCWSY